MRILLPAVLLAAGIAIGAAVPAISDFVRGTLVTAGVPPTLLAFTGPPAKAPEARHADGDGHDHDEGAGKAGHDHASHAPAAEPGKAAAAPAQGHAHGGHGHEEGEGHADEGVIKMRPEQVTGQDIKVAPVEGGTLARHLLVPGTITPDTDRIARVPAKVVGTVAEMRKRLGDAVRKGEVVAVLDSREVADAKSEYLTAVVRADLEKTNFDRQQALWDKRVSAESAYLNAKAVYTEATCGRTSPARSSPRSA